MRNTFYSGTDQPKLVTETDPVVTAAQNGPGTAVTTYKFLDSYGRVIWTKDGDGYVNYIAYDDGTGAITKTIIDVDYSKLTSAEQTSFNQTGWTQPTGGQDLVTITIPDGLGRPLAVIDPKGIVTAYAYNDANHEARLYPAWGAASHATGTGTTTTLVDTSLSSAGSYVGQVLTILSGTDAWYTATVTGYSASTHTLTFGTAFPSATDSSSLYVLSSDTTVGPVQVSREYRPTSFFVGQASATGTTTTLIDSALSSGGSYVGQLLSLTAGTDNGQSARIIGYNSTTHTVTVDQAFTAATDSTTQFVIGSRYEETMTELPSTGTSIALGSTNGQIGAGLPNGGEAIGTIYSLSRQLVNVSNQVIEQDDYFSLAGATYSAGLDYLGTASNDSATGNFHATLFWYDERGDLARTQEPTGTIFRTVYDYLQRPISKWEGTDDTPTSGWWTPTNTSGTNLVDIEDFQYDNGGVGDGNLTTDTKHVDTTASHDQVTLNLYDWRDRLIAVKQGALMSGGSNDLVTETGSGVNRLVTYYNLNNVGQTLGTYTYAGDGTDLSAFSTWTSSTDSTKLRAYTSQSFDNLGRVYQTKRYSVDPSTGSFSTSVALTTNLFYDNRSDLIAEADPGGLVYKHQYDGAGRDIKDSTTDGGAVAGVTMSWSNASTLTNDIVLEQKLFSFDPDSNLIETIDRQRFHGDPTTSTGRGDLAGPSGGNLASRDYYSASYYDAADRPTDSVNVGTNGGTAWTRPAAVPTSSDTVLVNHTDYDLAGRILDTVDPRDIKSGTFYDMLGRAIEVIGAWDGTSNPSAGSSSNQITTYQYNGLSDITSMTAKQASGGSEPDQTTDYVYGVGSTGALFSNDVIGVIAYPDKTTGNAASGPSEQQSFGYDFRGEKTGFTDQNGTTHQYNLDVLGRLTADIISTLGSGVDGSVMKLGYTFNDAGLPFQQTSYNSSSAVVNQVEDVYNGYEQLITQYQSDSGAVVVGTTGSVQYAYSTGDNNSRLTSITYPNTRVLNYVYSSGLDSAISRISGLADAAGSAHGFDVQYRYLGLSTVVIEAYGSSTNIPQLDYVKLSGSNGDAGDQYTGVDRFGRIVDQKWIDNHGGVPPVISTLDERQYGYDRDSNVLYMNNTQASSFSELYHVNSTASGDDNTAYDPLNRLQAFQRGTLSASGNNGSVFDTISTANTLADNSENYSLDALGNMSSVQVDGGTPTSRSVDAQNQVTADGSNALSFDNNGNMLVDEQGNHYTFDAWNRMVLVKDPTNTAVKETLQYDALSRGILDNNGGGDEQLFYDTAGHVIQEQFGSAYAQYVWGINGPVDLVLRDRNADGSGSTGNLGFTGSGLEEREFVMRDADGNVIGLLNTLGQVTERFAFSPYGKVIFLTASWTSGSDGTNNWAYFFQGMRVVDDGTNYSMYRSRTRTYDANLGTWGQEDPTGTQYVNGANLYQMEMGNPIDGVDPTGLSLDRTTDPNPAPPGSMGPNPRNRAQQGVGNVYEGSGDTFILSDPTGPFGWASGSAPGIMSPFAATTQPSGGGQIAIWFPEGPNQPPNKVTIINNPTPQPGSAAWDEYWSLVAKARVWNKTSPPWADNNQCNDQAVALMVYLLSLNPQHWHVNTDGGWNGWDLRYGYHHVVVLTPKGNNPLGPVVIDPFKWEGGPSDVRTMTGAEFRKKWPYDCSQLSKCCTSHCLPPTGKSWLQRLIELSAKM